MDEKNAGVLEQIRLYAKYLKVPGLADYPRLLRAAGPGDDFGTLLLRLLEQEYDRRLESQNARRLKQAGFPYTKTLEDLDLSRYRGKIADSFVRELSTCQFVRDRKNIVMLGNPGRGKTHMAIGLGLKACGQGMSVLFRNAARLSTELAEARESYMLGRLQKKLEKVDVLILDEMGYVKFNRHQSELLFDVFSERSERGSIIVTTNLQFSEWPSLFDGKGLVVAMIDRLTFNAHLLDMNGDSYRLEQARKARLGKLDRGLAAGTALPPGDAGTGGSGQQEGGAEEAGQDAGGPRGGGTDGEGHAREPESSDGNEGGADCEQ
ncbi:MAG: IS21-like element helper ATPase IstB [Desulfovibrio sp.]|nr:IS21-like element helper ATPase IstB [Desulfovibrio sp.]